MSIITNADYNKGFHDGTIHGAKKAKKAVAFEFVQRLQELRNEKGIGPKTWDKIIDCLDINNKEVQEENTESEEPNANGV